MAVDHDIIIAGGGLNGPTLALALSQAGLSVAVIDARPARARAGAGFDGRAYALALASRRLLTALGLWGGLADKAQPILRVEAAQGQPGEGAGPFHLVFDSAEIEEGPVGHMLEDRFLYAALVDAMEGRVTHLPGRQVTGQQEHPEYGNIQMVFTANPTELRQWVVTDDQGKKTTVILGEMQKGVQIPPSRFSITAEAERRR